MIGKVRGALQSARGSSIVRNAGWSLAGEVFFIFCQLAMFIMLTHAFTNDVYGVFGSTIALMLAVGPFSSAGAGYLLVERVVRKGEALGPAIGRAWFTSFLGGVAFILLLIPLQQLILPDTSLRLFIEVGVAELVFNQLVQVARYIGQALEKLWLITVMLTLGGLARVIVAYVYLVRVDNPTIENWGVLYAASVAVSVVAGAVLIWKHAGARPSLLVPRRRDISQGLTFSINVSSVNLKADADKTLLGTFRKLGDAGDYTSAYRILGLASLPNQALADATYSRFFNSGSVRAARDLAKKLSMVALVINAFTAAFYIVAAPYMVKLLGSSYEGAATILRWLAFVPLLTAAQLFAGNALSGAGHHRIRLLQTLSSAGLNIALNLALIPKYSWKGSAFATLVTEAWLLALHWRTLSKLTAQEQASADQLAAVDHYASDVEQDS